MFKTVHFFTKPYFPIIKFINEIKVAEVSYNWKKNLPLWYCPKFHRVTIPYEMVIIQYTKVACCNHVISYVTGFGKVWICSDHPYDANPFKLTRMSLITASSRPSANVYIVYLICHVDFIRLLKVRAFPEVAVIFCSLFSERCFLHCESAAFVVHRHICIQWFNSRVHESYCLNGHWYVKDDGHYW